MKFLFSLLMLAFALIAATVPQQPTITYTHNFPTGMDSALREYYIKSFEKGRILYRINCATCHNQKTEAGEIIPEFSKAMLARYELRVQNPDHAMNLSDVQIANEEYQSIMVFLNFLKKIDPPAAAAKKP